jgi:hypothetical protein
VVSNDTGTEDVREPQVIPVADGFDDDDDDDDDGNDDVADPGVERQ